ncbi:hypothetical protein [Brevibacillus brevis]|uniref:hypothetical protein n=1 Tax=Brevibacillus brevis TaxID=1393 RepID=UPI0007D89DB3|nr:hypothetical protein [Brevibacillus brevis]
MNSAEHYDIDFPDGWHIKVGQVYSSPYQSCHFLVTKIVLDQGDEINDAEIHYKEVNPQNYKEIYENEHHLWHRAWWVNDGNWDLERDVDLQ